MKVIIQTTVLVQIPSHLPTSKFWSLWLQIGITDTTNVSSGSTTMVFYNAQNFPWGFPRKHSNVSRIRKSYSKEEL